MMLLICKCTIDPWRNAKVALNLLNDFVKEKVEYIFEPMCNLYGSNMIDSQKLLFTEVERDIKNHSKFIFMWLNPKFNMLTYQKIMYNNLGTYNIKNDNIRNLLFNKVMSQSLKIYLMLKFSLQERKIYNHT